MKIAITGANSSVGKNLLSEIIQHSDLSAIAGVRSEHAIATLPKSERIDNAIISYDNTAELAQQLQGANCVVHLAGILMESKTSSYYSANVTATAAVIAAAKTAKVEHFVFISVIGASSNSSNAFFKSKGDAEQLISESGMSASIIRTPLLLGPNTAGANAIFGAASGETAKLLGGGNYNMCPLDIDDLSKAIVNCCKAQTAGTHIHELVGPKAMLYHEIVSAAAKLMGKTVTIGSIPIWSAKLGAAITSRLKGGGISPTVIDVITIDESVSHNADQDLGITLTSLENTFEKILSSRNSQ